jgi:translation initiation factor IF-2
VKAVIETKEPVKEPVKREKLLFGKKRVQKQRRPLQRKRLLLSIKKTGTKLTGQTIDLSQFNKPKRKKKS